MLPKLLLATRNRGKSSEIKAILGDLDIEIYDLTDFPELPEVIEDGKTLEENAIKKAEEIFKLTNLPALADDSGLEVFALGMSPGVISARYAGDNVSYEDNNRKLLRELRDIPSGKRSAQFRCVAALVTENIKSLAEGICRGKIIEDPRGSSGFGYDPLFVPDGYELTFAQLPVEVKNRISHRAFAFLKIKEEIKRYFNV